MLLTSCKEQKSSATTSSHVLEQYSRDELAPIKLEYVDFKIKRGMTIFDYGKKVGKYRYELFNCARKSKDVNLGQNRVFKSNMKFFESFFNEFNDFVPVVVNRVNRYYQYSDMIDFPHYILTAEITDLNLNVCDHYDWRTNYYSELRNGSADIQVTWRLLDPEKKEIFWKKTSDGFSDIIDPIRNGEVHLIELAFEDALKNIKHDQTLSQILQDTLSNGEISSIKKRLGHLKFTHDNVRKNYLLKQYIKSNNLDVDKVNQLIKQGKYISKETAKKTVEDAKTKKHKLISKTLYNEKGEPYYVDKDGRTIHFDEEAKPYYKDQDGKEYIIDTKGNVIYKDEIPKKKEVAKVESKKLDTPFVKAKPISEKELIKKVANIIEELTSQDESSDKKYIAKKQDKPLKHAGWEKPEIKKSQAYKQDKKRFSITNNDIIIENVKPFDVLDAENLYKLRASVVGVKNVNSLIGSGIIISPDYVLTSNRLVTESRLKDKALKIYTINDQNFTGLPIRQNKKEGSALIKTFSPTGYSPLALRLDLPKIGEEVFIALGAPSEKIGEGYLDDGGRVKGYRFKENGTEIIVDTFVQENTLGGALIDNKGNIIGMARSGTRKKDQKEDYFMPIANALKSLNVRIKNRVFPEVPDYAKEKKK
jgi:S1-C subfamily serine protease